MVSRRFALPRRRSDDAQVAGVDDYLAKVQHGGLKERKGRVVEVTVGRKMKILVRINNEMSNISVTLTFWLTEGPKSTCLMKHSDQLSIDNNISDFRGLNDGSVV